MLFQTQLQEIKQHLEKSQNPLFFFDNDVDGLISFILFQRAIKRGKGIPIKSFPELDASYLKRVDELKPDYVFILDKPKVSEDFIEGILERNLPLVWIDHHDELLKEETKNKLNYFNSFPPGEPTTYIAQKTFESKEDIWLATIGCIADNFIPDFLEKYAKENKEIISTHKSAFDCLYNTEIGKITLMLNFGLRDTTTNVVQMIKLLIKTKSPQDILEENKETKQIHYRYNKLMEQLKNTIKKAKRINKNLILVEYGGETSMSSEVANRIQFENPDKIVLVIFKKTDTCNISIRGKSSKQILLESIKNIQGATGGGHPEASGARIPTESLEEFKQNIFELTK